VAIFFKSVPQMPQVCTRTNNSPAPMPGTGTVSSRTSLRPRYTAACMVAGMTWVRSNAEFWVTVCIDNSGLHASKFHSYKIGYRLLKKILRFARNDTSPRMALKEILHLPSFKPFFLNPEI
jgi:hypothetical protein